MIDDQSTLATLLDGIQTRLQALSRTASPQGLERLEPVSIPSGSALGRIQHVFQLSSFEVGLLLLPIAVELCPGLDDVLATLAGSPLQRAPTLSLALAILPEPHWDAIAPQAPLRHYHLIQLGPGDIFSRRPITVEERVLHALMGVPSMDLRVQRRVIPLRNGGPLPPSYEAIAQDVGQTLVADSPTLLQLDGTDALTRRSIVAEACEARGLQGYCLNGQDVPLDVADQELLLQLWAREAGLEAIALLVELPSPQAVDVLRATIAFLERVEGRVVCSSDGEKLALGRVVKRLPIPTLTFEQRLELWQTAFAPNITVPESTLAPIAAQFRLDRGRILATATTVQETLQNQPQIAVEPLLWQTCREQARPQLQGLIQSVRVTATLKQLVLPELPMQMLRATVGQVRKKAQVHYQWGFAERGERGAGTTVIFAGPSGTGKTMAAEAIAHALDLNLYRIDLSAVVSKYIGETEENLRAVFDAAEAGGAILLFDEADALFGKRTEVRDSHDRHANIEVSYLLQRMESYEGLAILTTNLRKSVDDAFLRRMQFIVDFPFPDKSLRRRIWQGIFPSATPCEGLDYDQLAQLSVAGGNIASIARNGAYLAAAAGDSVTMAHLLTAARLEYAKLSRTIPAGEIQGWLGSQAM